MSGGRCDLFLSVDSDRPLSRRGYHQTWRAARLSWCLAYTLCYVTYLLNAAFRLEVSTRAHEYWF